MNMNAITHKLFLFSSSFLAVPALICTGVFAAEIDEAVFSIWLGNTPIDDTFRDTLLGI